MLLRSAAEFTSGYLYVKGVENPMHKHILHGLGKDKKSIWNFHWGDHHKSPVKYGMHDPAYGVSFWLHPSREKEVASLVLGFVAHLPLAKKYPYFVLGVGVGALEYYYKHKKAHLDPEWAFDHMQNHVKHHLYDQNNYWGVTSGLLDKLMGTAPEVSPQEWDELRRFYLNRYEEMKGKAEQTAKQTALESKEKMKHSLDSLTQRLYSFLGRK